MQVLVIVLLIEVHEQSPRKPLEAFQMIWIFLFFFDVRCLHVYARQVFINFIHTCCISNFKSTK